MTQKIIQINPIISSICAVSCGIVKGETLLDLDYEEDSKCETDANFVINQNFDLIEIQGTAEQGAITFDQLTEMYKLAKKAGEEIFNLQKKFL